MAHASFDGLRVLSLETRRAKEVEKLIRTYCGQPFVVPAMREVRLESNHAALDFADKLMQGEIDVVLFLTGVGVRVLLEIVETRYEREAFLEALRSVKIVTRGAKPEAALREIKVRSVATASEPMECPAFSVPVRNDKTGTERILRWDEARSIRQNRL